MANKWICAASPALGSDEDYFTLSAPVGPGQRNRRQDVLKVEALLGQTGDLDVGVMQGPTGFWTPLKEQAVKRYQARRNLFVDGRLDPGGPTIQALKRQIGLLFSRLTPPTPDQVDQHHEDLRQGGRGLLQIRLPASV